MERTRETEGSIAKRLDRSCGEGQLSNAIRSSASAH